MMESKVVRVHTVRRAALFFLSAQFFYSSQGALVKITADGVPFLMLVMIQLTTAFAVLLPWILLQPCSLKTHRLGEQLLRSVAMVANFYLIYLALRRIPLSDAILLNNTLPLWVPLIWWITTRKSVRPSVWIAIVIGFVGVALIVRPDANLFQPGSLLALGAAICASVGVVIISRLATTEPFARILFYPLCLGTLVSLPFGIAHWEPLTLSTWILLLTSGLCLAAFQLLLIRAFSLGAPGPVSAMAYTSVLFAGLFDWILWDRTPHLTFIIGALLIVASGLRILCMKK